MSKIAWVSGASGLIGQHLISQLIANPDFSKVIAFVRKPLDKAVYQHEKVEQFVVDYDHLEAPTKKVDALFCALGTTQKRTPNYDDYYRIDVTYPYEFAKLGKEYGAEFLGLVSSHGANRSSGSRYLRFKGLVEKDVTKLYFKNLAIARPSLLKGEREEFRLLEKMSESLMSIMPGNYKAIDASKVAQSLVLASEKLTLKIRMLSSKEMQNPASIRF